MSIRTVLTTSNNINRLDILVQPLCDNLRPVVAKGRISFTASLEIGGGNPAHWLSIRRGRWNVPNVNLLGSRKLATHLKRVRNPNGLAGIAITVVIGGKRRTRETKMVISHEQVWKQEADAETSLFLDDVLEFFQENNGKRAMEFEVWKSSRENKEKTNNDFI